MSEVTDEMIDDALKCKLRCDFCRMAKTSGCAQALAQALKEERAKPKGDFWKDAHTEAVLASVAFYNNPIKTGKSYICTKEYTRELPKTKERLLAEKASDRIRDYLINKNGNDMREVYSIIETAILDSKDGK